MNLRIHETFSGQAGGSAVLALIAALLLVVGCSDDEVNTVGNSLIGPQIDTLLVPLNVEILDDFGTLAVEDDDVPFDENETLYFGTQGTERSSILLRYDFGALREGFEGEVPDFSDSNIVAVELRFYFANALDTPRKTFGVQELLEPLDTSPYPGPLPSGLVEEGVFIGWLDEGFTDIEESISLDVDRFITWWQAGEHNGLLITEQPAVTNVDGFVAVASKENRHARSTIDGNLDENTVYGPALSIELINMPEDSGEDIAIILLPSEDVSTLEVLDPLPSDFADGFTMRTHLRSYPYLSFDLSDLPPDVLINRAELWVGLDTLSSYGPIESIVVAEIGGAFTEGAGGATTLDALCDATTLVDGRSSVDAQAGENHRLRFNVTMSCQRLVNGLFDGSFGFLLAPGEDCFPSYDMTSLDPDFYMTRFNFFGTAAPDSLRPQLKILYSSVDDLTGGGR